MPRATENTVDYMTTSSKIKILVLITAALLLFSGCQRPGGTEQEPTGLPTSSPAATNAPVSGGALRLPMPVNASSDDPLDVNTEEMFNLFSLVYDRLLTVNASGEIEPCLCESWTSEGGGVWLLKLRDGVTWHDGSKLRAQDVLDTFRRIQSMESGYYKSCLEHLMAIDIVDELSVRARLNVRGLIGLYSLVFPISKSAPLVGTGAYRLESRRDGIITLRVNEDWWDKLPYIERIIFAARDSNSTSLASFEAGQLNMVPTDILTAGRYRETGVTNVLDVMTQSMEVLLFNHKDSVFTNNSLRLAVAHGINRSRIITNVYMNRARAADVPFPPDSWLYDGRSAVLGYSPEQAASLVEEAGYTVLSKEGLRYALSGSHLSVKLLTSATTENTVRSDAANLIASQLKSLGFIVEVVTKPHTLGDSESEFIEALREGDWDMALVGFNLGLGNELTSYLDPDGANNFGHIDDPELSSKVLNMSFAETEEELRAAAYELQSYFVGTLPFMPLYFKLNSIIYSAHIYGVDGAREPMLFSDEKNWWYK